MKINNMVTEFAKRRILINGFRRNVIFNKRTLKRKLVEHSMNLTLKGPEETVHARKCFIINSINIKEM